MSSAQSPRSISAVTLLVADMDRSLRFYTSLGFEIRYGGPDADFSSLRVGDQFLNLMATDRPPVSGWGRVIFHVADVDATYRLMLEAGHRPDAPPHDASWGERFFHVSDPDGHWLSFARPL